MGLGDLAPLNFFSEDNEPECLVLNLEDRFIQVPVNTPPHPKNLPWRGACNHHTFLHTFIDGKTVESSVYVSDMQIALWGGGRRCMICDVQLLSGMGSHFPVQRQKESAEVKILVLQKVQI